ncbi:hypothetical protein DFP73DRAFT_624173 [Morchella snyderi]|nr:hypothetical protein DFP73DRAFT_624173 [Morchella snyderi]
MVHGRDGCWPHATTTLRTIQTIPLGVYLYFVTFYSKSKFLFEHAVPVVVLTCIYTIAFLLCYRYGRLNPSPVALLDLFTIVLWIYSAARSVFESADWKRVTMAFVLVGIMCVQTFPPSVSVDALAMVVWGKEARRLGAEEMPQAESILEAVVPGMVEAPVGAVRRTEPVPEAITSKIVETPADIEIQVELMSRAIVPGIVETPARD